MAVATETYKRAGQDFLVPNKTQEMWSYQQEKKKKPFFCLSLYGWAE